MINEENGYMASKEDSVEAAEISFGAMVILLLAAAIWSALS